MKRAARGVLLLVTMGGVACGGQSGAAGSGGRGGMAGTGGAGAAGNGGASNVGAGSAFPTGIGTEWKWQGGVVAHTAGPYSPCGIVGTGRVTIGAANPAAQEIAAASRSGVVLFYSPETGKQVRSPYYAAGPVSSVDYSPDGTQLVVTGDTGIQVVRLADRKVLFSAQPFAFSARAASLSPDGSLMAALGWDTRPTTTSPVFFVRLLRVSDGALLAETGVSAVDSVPPQFSSDGRLLAAGSQILSVPDLQAQPPLGVSSVQNALFSPDGMRVAIGGHILDVVTRRELKGLAQEQEGHFLWSAFSPDGALYAESFSEFTGSTVHLWRTSDWTPIGTPTPIAYAPEGSDITDGRFFFSGDGTRLISTLSARSGIYVGPAVFQILSVPQLAPQKVITEPKFAYAGGPLALSPDGALVTSLLDDGQSGVWRTADLSLLASLPGPVTDYGFLANGMLAVLPSGIYNPLGGARLGSALGSAISLDGRLAIVGSDVSTSLIVRLADLTTQAILHDTNAFSSTLPSGWAFSRDGRYVAVGDYASSETARVRVFDAMTGSLLTTLPGAAPLALATTPNGAVRLAAFIPAALSVANVRVWSVPEGKALFDIPQVTAKNWSPTSMTVPLAFSPDGTLIAAGAQNIRIFQVETGTLRETLHGHTDEEDPRWTYSGVTSLSFSATGQIASVGWDGTMRLWCSP